jgi:hypothetical protein
MIFGLNAIEMIAVLFALFILVKMAFLFVKKEAWFNAMVKPSIKNSKGIVIVFLVLAAVIFYYLIQALSIVEIFAVLAFSSFLIFLSLFAYSEDLFKFANKIYSKKFNFWMWLQIVIWFVLAVWVLVVVFG